MKYSLNKLLFANILLFPVLSEAAFGKLGWILCNLNMFMMAWGPMLSYMMIVKDTLGRVLGYSEEDVAGQKMVLMVSSVLVMLPLSLQRVRLFYFFNLYFGCVLNRTKKLM